MDNEQINIETSVNGTEEAVSKMDNLSIGTLEAIIASEGLGDSFSKLQSIIQSFQTGQIEDSLKPFVNQLNNINNIVSSISGKIKGQEIVGNQKDIRIVKSQINDEIKNAYMARTGDIPGLRIRALREQGNSTEYENFFNGKINVEDIKAGLLNSILKGFLDTNRKSEFSRDIAYRVIESNRDKTDGTLKLNSKSIYKDVYDEFNKEVEAKKAEIDVGTIEEVITSFTDIIKGSTEDLKQAQVEFEELANDMKGFKNDFSKKSSENKDNQKNFEEKSNETKKAKEDFDYKSFVNKFNGDFGSIFDAIFSKAVKENRAISGEDIQILYNNDTVKNIEKLVSQKTEALKKFKDDAITEDMTESLQSYLKNLKRKIKEVIDKGFNATVESVDKDGNKVFQNQPLFEFGKMPEEAEEKLGKVNSIIGELLTTITNTDLESLNEEQFGKVIQNVSKLTKSLTSVHELIANAPLANSNHKNVMASSRYLKDSALINSGLFDANENAKAVRNIMQAASAGYNNELEQLKELNNIRSHYIQTINKAVSAFNQNYYKQEQENRRLQKEKDKYSAYSEGGFKASVKDSLRLFNTRALNRNTLGGFALRGVDRLSKFTKLGDVSPRLNSKGEVIKGSGINLVTTGAAVAGMAVAKLGKELINLSKNALRAFGDIESIKVNLGVVYGNQSEANQMFSELSDYARKSPFGVQTVSEFALLLKQSGVYSNELLDTLKMIGDVSGGNQEKMKRIANNYAQIVAMGKANSIDLRQFANAGIPIYEMLRDELKIDQAGVRQQAAAGEITSDVIEKVFKKMTSEGGVFYKAVDKGAETYKARMQNLEDAKQLALSEAGEWLFNFGGIGTDIVNFMEGFNSHWENVFDKWNTSRDLNEAKDFKEQFGKYSKSYNTLISSLERNTDFVGENSALINTLNNSMDTFYSKNKDKQRSAEAEEYFKIKSKTSDYEYALNLANEMLAPIKDKTDIINSLKNIYENEAVENFEYLDSDKSKLNENYESISDYIPLLRLIENSIIDYVNPSVKSTWKYSDPEFLAQDIIMGILTGKDYSPITGGVLNLDWVLNKKDKKRLPEVKPAGMEVMTIDTGTGLSTELKKNSLNSKSSAFSISSFIESEYKKSDAYKAKEDEQRERKFQEARDLVELQKELEIGNNLYWFKKQYDSSAKDIFEIIKKFYSGETVNTTAEAMTNDDRRIILSNVEALKDLFTNNQELNRYLPNLEMKLNEKTGNSAYTLYELLQKSDRDKNNLRINNEYILQGLGDLFESLKNVTASEEVKKLFNSILLNPIANLVDEDKLNAALKNIEKEQDKKFTPFWKRFTSSIFNIAIESFEDEVDVFKRYTDKASREMNTAIADALILDGKNADKYIKRTSDGNIDQYQTSLAYQKYAISSGSSYAVTKAYYDALSKEEQTLRAFKTGKYFQREDLDKLWDNEWAKNLGYEGKEDFITAFSGTEDAVNKAKLAIEKEVDSIYKNIRARKDEVEIISNLKSAVKDIENEFNENQYNKQAKNILESSPKLKEFDSTRLDQIIEMFKKMYTTASGFNSESALKEIEKFANNQELDTEWLKEYNPTKVSEANNKIEENNLRIEELQNKINKNNEQLNPLQTEREKSESNHNNKAKGLEDKINENQKWLDDFSVKALEADEIIRKYGFKNWDAFISQYYGKSWKKIPKSIFRNGEEEGLRKVREVYNLQDEVEPRKSLITKLKVEQTKLENDDEYKTNINGLDVKISVITNENKETQEEIDKLTKENEKLKKVTGETWIKSDPNATVNKGKDVLTQSQISDYQDILKAYTENTGFIQWKELKNNNKPGIKNNFIGNSIASAFGVGEEFPILPTYRNKEGKLITENTVKQQRLLNRFGAPEGTNFENFWTSNKDYITETYRTLGFSPEKLGKLDEKGNIEFNLKSGEKMLDTIDNVIYGLEKGAEAARELGSSLDSAFTTFLSDGFSNTMQSLGKHLATDADTSEDIADAWKNAGKAMMEQLAATATDTGLKLIGAGALRNNWGLIGTGLGLVATGGLLNIGLGALNANEDNDDSTNKAEQQAARLKSLKEDLSDLLEQAKLDAEYYLVNSRHQDALSSIYTKQEANRKVNDAIITPNGNVISTHPDDYLIATKTPETLLSRNMGSVNVSFSPSINVINNTSSQIDVKTSERTGENGNLEIDVIIENLVGSKIANGTFDSAFAKRQQRINGRSVSF